ncbi:hypothetical protein BV25DRAFT_1831944 [Artomyces pyxidatus]|uniref:Uncharacterized protein n=1 Tax=Artomyces pyxidatus TaxID=48021 RepID=A0ACB8SKE5_9AGAM|nr:hypothetical protein BV25DRAFT_1831944 [Artomyces pyxidatus]
MRARAHQLLVMPGIIQAFVIDTGAHFPYEAVFVKAADFGEPFVRDDWLVRFKAAVDAT